MEKVLIYEDTRQIKETLERIHKHIPVLQRIVSGFSACNTSVDLFEIRDMINLFSQNSRIYDRGNAIETYIEELLRQKVVDEMKEIPKINGVAIDKMKLAEMVKLPDFSELTKDIYSYRNRYFSLGYVEFDLLEIDNQSVKLKPDATEKIKETHRKYVHTEKGLLVYNQAKSIADSLNKLGELVYKDKLPGISFDCKSSVVQRVDDKWIVDASWVFNVDSQERQRIERMS